MAWPTGSRATWDLKIISFFEIGWFRGEDAWEVCFGGLWEFGVFSRRLDLEKDYLQSLWTHFECFFVRKKPKNCQCTDGVLPLGGKITKIVTVQSIFICTQWRNNESKLMIPGRVVLGTWRELCHLQGSPASTKTHERLLYTLFISYENLWHWHHVLLNMYTQKYIYYKIYTRCTFSCAHYTRVAKSIRGDSSIYYDDIRILIHLCICIVTDMFFKHTHTEHVCKIHALHNMCTHICLPVGVSYKTNIHSLQRPSLACPTWCQRTARWQFRLVGWWWLSESLYHQYGQFTVAVVTSHRGLGQLYDLSWQFIEILLLMLGNPFS